MIYYECESDRVRAREKRSVTQMGIQSNPRNHIDGGSPHSQGVIGQIKDKLTPGARKSLG